MRILIDTCIFIHYSTDMGLLSKDVISLLEDTENIICISAETLRELVVSYNNGGLVSKYWPSARKIWNIQKICLPLQQIIKHRHSFLNGHGRPRAAFFMK